MVITFKVKQKEYSLNWLSLFVIVSLIDLFYIFMGSIAINFYDDTLLESGLDDLNNFEIFFLTVIIAPLLETLIFQFLVIEGLFMLKIKPKYIVLVSSMLFAIIHSYNLVYVLFIVFLGILYAIYYTLLRKHGRYMAFGSVAILHAMLNLTAFLVDDVYELDLNQLLIDALG